MQQSNQYAKSYRFCQRKPSGLMVEEVGKQAWQTVSSLTYFNYGEVIATAELVACHLITEEYLYLPDTEKALGDYSLGRYAWELRNVKELPEPIKAKGQQGLWSWRHNMNITIKTVETRRRRAYMPPAPIPTYRTQASPDWRLVTCPELRPGVLGVRACASSKGSGAAGVCTECALRAANTPGVR
ncbi:MAG: hypothetical protein ACLTBV_31015 [Enterocloster bolteae]